MLARANTIEVLLLLYKEPSILMKHSQTILPKLFFAVRVADVMLIYIFSPVLMSYLISLSLMLAVRELSLIGLKDGHLVFMTPDFVGFFNAQ